MLARDLARSLDPIEFALDCGLEPDGWQADALLSEERKELWLCSRQTGKSTTAAVLALHEAIYRPPALIPLISPSQRQSGELFRKVTGYYHALDGKPEILRESALRMELTNGSRIVSLPGTGQTIRGLSAPSMVIVDEAAQASDDLMGAVRPMLATTNGRIIALTTPYGRRGWFFKAWTEGQDWRRVKVLAEDCPRITPEFLADERAELGEWLYDQEYGCRFTDTSDQYFSSEIIEAAISADVVPFFA